MEIGKLMADSQKSMTDSSFRNNAAVCARQALDATHTPLASACSPGRNPTPGGNSPSTVPGWPIWPCTMAANKAAK